MERLYALSLKQPWATLMVHGLKSIEVRRWPTTRRGKFLIHAARVPDPRAEAWRHVPPHLMEHAQLAGGIVGQADIIGCATYRTLEKFLEDQKLHLNEPAWFEPAGLFGFTFANQEVLPYRPYPGWMRFFPVDSEGTPTFPRAKKKV